MLFNIYMEAFHIPEKISVSQVSETAKASLTLDKWTALLKYDVKS